jgi:hypothetical protein
MWRATACSTFWLVPALQVLAVVGDDRQAVAAVEFQLVHGLVRDSLANSTCGERWRVTGPGRAGWPAAGTPGRPDGPFAAANGPGSGASRRRR